MKLRMYEYYVPGSLLFYYCAIFVQLGTSNEEVYRPRKSPARPKGLLLLGSGDYLRTERRSQTSIALSRG